MGEHNVVIRCQRQINLKNLPPNMVVLIEGHQRMCIGLVIQQPASVGNIYAAPFTSKIWPPF